MAGSIRTSRSAAISSSGRAFSSTPSFTPSTRRSAASACTANSAARNSANSTTATCSAPGDSRRPARRPARTPALTQGPGENRALQQEHRCMADRDGRGVTSGERTRLACWSRRPAATNFRQWTIDVTRARLQPSPTGSSRWRGRHRQHARRVRSPDDAPRIRLSPWPPRPPRGTRPRRSADGILLRRGRTRGRRPRRSNTSSLPNGRPRRALPAALDLLRRGYLTPPKTLGHTFVNAWTLSPQLSEFDCVVATVGHQAICPRGLRGGRALAHAARRDPMRPVCIIVIRRCAGRSPARC